MEVAVLIMFPGDKFKFSVVSVRYVIVKVIIIILLFYHR